MSRDCETTAPVNINEWITMRIEIGGKRAHMFINDAKYSTFVVETMLGKTTHGSIALWVDIGTIGYFKRLDGDQEIEICRGDHIENRVLD